MLKTRLIILGLVLAIGAGVALFVALLWVPLPLSSAPPRIQNTATMLKRVQTLSELVTVKYVLEKVVILEDIKWYGENRVLLVAHGVVKAGVDLQEIKPEDVRVDDKKVVVKLPPARITDVYLDDKKTRVVDRTTGLLRAVDQPFPPTRPRSRIRDQQIMIGSGGRLRFRVPMGDRAIKQRKSRLASQSSFCLAVRAE